MPDADVHTALDSLRSLAPRLNSLTDQANLVVQSIESFLNSKLSVGVPAHVTITSSGEGGAGKYLEYRRVGSSYRIAIVISDERGEDVSVKAWAECSREDKLSSFKHLPALLARVEQNVKAALDETEAAIQVVSSILSSLTEDQDASPAPQRGARRGFSGRRSAPPQEAPADDEQGDIPF